MSHNWKFSLIVLGLALGLGTALMFAAAQRQTARQAAAMTLIRDLDRVDQRLSQASREFGLALQDYLSNQMGRDGRGENLSEQESGGGDRGALEQAHRVLAESVSQSIAVVSRLKAPASEHGAALIAAQRRFLLVQREIVRKDFGQLLELLEPSAQSRSEQLDAVERVVDGAFEKTETEFAAVATVREKFAREFAITLNVQE